MEFSSIKNIDRQSVPFDENKSILFLDIDGVLNPLPWERRWVGPDDVTSWWDPALNDPNNWVWDEVPIDPKKHFEVTRTFEYRNDMWAHLDDGYQKYLTETKGEEKRYKLVKVGVADEMLDGIRQLVSDFDLQIIYLTYWKDDALRNLEPDVNLGANAYLDWFAESSRGIAMKINALHEFTQESGFRQPYAFLDDEATENVVGIKKFFHVNEYLAKRDPEHKKLIRELNEIPRKFFHVDKHYGISRHELSELRKFYSENL